MSKPIRIYEDMIVEEHDEVCVYCYTPKRGFSCCEENHFSKGYEMVDGEIYLDDDVVIHTRSSSEILQEHMEKLAEDAYESSRCGND